LTIPHKNKTGVRAVPASILLYGPPGCGKTKLAKAVAGEAQAAFLSIGPSDVLSKFVGESEASIKQLFEQAKDMASRMESRCCVLFFDEIDALGMSRGGSGGGQGGSEGAKDGGGSSENSSRRILAELLIQLTSLAEDMDLSDDATDLHTGTDIRQCDVHSEHDKNCHDEETKGINNGKYEGKDDNSPRPISPASEESNNDYHSSDKATQLSIANADANPNSPQSNTNANVKPRIIVIAATNRPEDCDPALLRRFAIRVLVGLPSQRDRKKILSRLLEGIDNAISVEQLKELSCEMEGWSGSDLESVTREAVMAPIRECLRSAAIMKMKMKKKAEQSAVRSKNDFNRNKAISLEITNEMARDELLNKFQKLRPVTVEDFQEAITFWIGEDGQDQMTAQMMNEASTCHYDSDSSLEEVDE
jgi:SpoVK/Ycf46/Vps4 family AAA+-type ATPase